MSTDSTSSEAAPRVFISHASEDKDRFVLEFAEELRAAGIDAWIDRWEMLPGDSLVRKIFSEGLDDADAVIVILSAISISKPWVAEELDAAVVKRINDDSKLIPIVLDNLDIRTEVPASIRHLLLEYVPDPSQRDDTVKRVIRSVYGTVERPPLGPPPVFTRAPAVHLPGLDRLDSLMLKLIGSQVVNTSNPMINTVNFVADAVEMHGVTEAQVVESLQVLEGEHYLDIHRTLGQGIEAMRIFMVTTQGLEIYLRAYEPNYPQFEQTIFARIAERTDGRGTERDLVNSSDVPSMIARHLLEVLESGGYLSLSRPLGPQNWYYYNVSPRLRRRSTP